MSVSCEQFIGYTLTLKEKLTHEDYRFFDEFESKHPEYRKNREAGQVALIVDGMNGEYARLVYIEKHLKDCHYDGDEYYSVLSSEKPDYDVYSAITQAYEEMYGTAFGFVNANRIEHAMWFHYS